MPSNSHNAQNQNAVNHIAQFYQSVLQHNLPQAAILLWLSLYLRMQAQGVFSDMHIATADLMNELDISRSGLQRARQRLTNAGLLHMEQKAHQALHYTLCLNGDALQARDMTTVAAVQTQTDKQDCAEAVRSETVPPTVMQQAACPTDRASLAEVILSGKYSAALDAFHQRYPDAILRGSLRNWAEQRQKNGWALTAWGLQVLLDKLVELADGDIKTMTAIVAQSIQKRWKGFHKLKIEARPSGEALRKLEEKEERAEMQRYRATGTRMPMYKSSYKQDLSALVI